MATMLLAVGVLGYACVPAAAAVRIEGQVQAGGGPLANSTVTLWGASAGAPRQLAQARTGSDGRFQLGSQEALGTDVTLYLIAKGGEAAVNKGSGDNPAIAMLAVLGNTPPPNVVINEMTTVASVWTHAQFLNGAAVKGHALGLRIAAGNVPNFVDLQTGGWGATIQDPLNSGQTPPPGRSRYPSPFPHVRVARHATSRDARACKSRHTPSRHDTRQSIASPHRRVLPLRTISPDERRGDDCAGRRATSSTRRLHRLSARRTRSSPGAGCRPVSGSQNQGTAQ